MRRLKDHTEEAVSNGNSREILNWRCSKTKLLVEKRVVGETKERRGRPSFIDARRWISESIHLESLCSKVKTLTSLVDNHMTIASCWQQLQIGHSLIIGSFCIVVYFVRNSLLKLLLEGE